MNIEHDVLSIILIVIGAICILLIFKPLPKYVCKKCGSRRIQNNKCADCGQYYTFLRKIMDTQHGNKIKILWDNKFYGIALGIVIALLYALRHYIRMM
jgi:hypothetical protein